MLIEDLVSTGSNAIKALHEMQLAGGDVMGMVAMFTYDFEQAIATFKEEGLKLIALTNYHAMIEAALATQYIKDEDVDTLELWHDDPESWTPERYETIGD